MARTSKNLEVLENVRYDATKCPMLAKAMLENAILANGSRKHTGSGGGNLECEAVRSTLEDAFCSHAYKVCKALDTQIHGKSHVHRGGHSGKQQDKHGIEARYRHYERTESRRDKDKSTRAQEEAVKGHVQKL